MDTNNPESLWEFFDARKRELEQAEDHAWRWFVGNIAMLFVVTPLIFIGFTVNAMAASWLEFGVALPLAYSAVFFHRQHSKAREYLEEYTFKSVVARSLEAYRLLLKEDVDPKREEEQKKFLDFMMDSAKSLHVSPRMIISKNPVKSEEDVKVGIVEKLADVFKKFLVK